MRPQTIVERLDFVAKRIQGLKFTPPTQLKPGDEQFYGCFMSCDMYYIEIKVDQSHQSVKDVIISHGNSADGISCPVMRKVLADQDFETFAKHLSGLHSIYLINTNDKKVKQRAYPALTSLENDLSTLYDIQRRKVNNCHDLVHKSPIGFMEPRKGGLPVRLTYFITPYDLVDTTQRLVNKPTADSIMNKGLGLSALVEIEGSSPHKIQVKPLIMQNNSSLPAYAAFNSQNSEKLPAQFVLKLSQPFPMLITSINQITNEINEPATIKDFINSLTTDSKESIVTLIARQELDLNKGPFGRTFDALKSAHIESCDLKKHVYSVRLPDQAHTYHVLESYLERPEGVYVTKLPFTHPTSIPSILKILRQQALFNFVVGSCIRRSKQSNGQSSNTTEFDSIPKNDQVSNIFDLIPVSLSNICISFENPSKESLATLEIDLKELSCQLYALDKDSVCSDEFATKVLQKCWSIPITLRSVLKKCNEKRLALLEDSNKRRERELQELLTNNTTAQQGLQLKTNPKYQDALLQNKFNNLNEKTSSRDLNSIAEFLSSKVNTASTSVNNNDQVSCQSDSSNRTNLLKKFSCKPKVKQSTATKSQTGNKILSLMLKRQNSTPLSEDQNLKVPLIKKVKTKHLTGELGSSDNPTGLMTTKLITPDAARLATKQAKQHATSGNQNVSISLIRSPSKVQPSPANVSSINNQTNTASILPTNTFNASQKQSESSGPRINDIVNNIKIKAQANGANSTVSGSGKPRKSSIGALLDRLVGNVTPEQQQQMQQQQQQQQQQQLQNTLSAQLTNSNDDVKSVNFNGAKSKSSRLPGGDQFAIKQGSSGGGLKLTVTKTKPTPQGSSSNTAGSTSAVMSPSSTAISFASTNSSSTSTNSSSSNNKSEAANKIIDLGSSTPSIRYTIPKISKSQQASQSSNASNESSNSNDSQGDESNPSSSANAPSTAPSSTTAAKQRTTSNPFKQTGNAIRNSVSSSTHPQARTTSNPLANPNRPSSTSNNIINDCNLQNRISSSSSNNNSGLSGLLNQQVANIARQQLTPTNRSLNLTSQQHIAQQSPIVPTLQQLPNIQHMINPAILGQPQAQQAQQLIRQQVPPLFSLRLPNHRNAFPNPNDLNLIMASQAALLNQQKQMQIQQQQQQLLQQAQQHLQSQQLSCIPRLAQPQQSHVQQQPLPHQARVSSSTEPSMETDQSFGNVAQSSTMASTSTPSSPTECGQIETVAPPPLIPIDSLHEANIASPDYDDHDDESDRLSIVDMNEAAPECNSTAGTPKSSQVDSPMEVQESMITTAATTSLSSSSSSSSTAAIHATSSSSPAATTTTTATTAAAATTGE